MPFPVEVSIDASGLTDGTYQGQIVINSPDLGDSPQTVDVTLIVGTPSTSSYQVYLPLVRR
jgi:hypothetical protein